MQEERKDEEDFVGVNKRASDDQAPPTTKVEIEVKQDHDTSAATNPAATNPVATNLATSNNIEVEEYVHVSDNIPFGGGPTDVSALQTKTFSQTTGKDIPTRHQEHSKIIDRVPLGGGPTDTTALPVKALAVSDGKSRVGRHTAPKARVMIKKGDGIVTGVGTAGLPVSKVKQKQDSESTFPPSSKKQNQVGAATGTCTSRGTWNAIKDKHWSRKEHAWLGSQDGPTLSQDKVWRDRQRSANEMKWDKTKRQWIPRGHKDEVRYRSVNWDKRLSQWMKATTDNAGSGVAVTPTPSKESTWRIVNRTRSVQVVGSTRSAVRWDKSTQQWLAPSNPNSKGRRASAPGQLQVSQLLSNTESGSQPLRATTPPRRNSNVRKYKRSGQMSANITDSLPFGGKLDAERSKQSTVYDQDSATRPTNMSPRKRCFASQGSKGQLFMKDNLSRCVEDSLNQTNAVRTGVVWKSKQVGVPAAAPKRIVNVSRDPARRPSDAVLNSANVAAALRVGDARVSDNNDKIANRGHRFLAPRVTYVNPQRGYGAHVSQVVLG